MTIDTGRPIGRDNPLVSRVKRLSRSPAERASSRLMIAEGVRLIEEALSARWPLDAVILSPRLTRDERGRRLLAALTTTGAPIHRATDALMESLHDARSHQGVLAIARRPDAALTHLIPAAPRPALVLVAVGVQDAGNAGTLVRLTDACGGSGVAMAAGADPFGPKALRASAGSIFRLPVMRVAGAAELPGILAQLRQQGLVLAGAAPRHGVNFTHADLSRPMALVVGGEGGGLPAQVTEALQIRLTIPMRQPAESLNVASAAAVLLFEASRRLRLI